MGDPDVIYQYTYPMNFSAKTQDPHTFIVDVVNLVEHPRLKDKDGAGPRSKQISDQTSQVRGIAGGAGASSAAGLTPGVASGGVSAHLSLSGAESPEKPAAESTAGYQNLFRKYIDNRLLLFVQESRFPRKLDFSITEPCSQLVWRHQVEPRMITTGMASLHLVDQATLEMFVALMLDENENSSAEDEKVFEEKR